MERDGLVVVSGDRHLELTARGREAATRVMRKHRLAECLLVDVLQMPWEDVHAEACRWEHVMSDAVERRLLEVLGNPTVSPYGNPIPGLAELNPHTQEIPIVTGTLRSLSEAVSVDPVRMTVRRIAEPIQTDAHLMTNLRRVGAVPGAAVTAHRTSSGVMVGSGGEYVEIPTEEALHIFVDSGS
jgi:DtxR family Mn-dependent transcriptional regulator